uniref:Uncharacterized protein n=1 Tax=Wuchereria bancrofti TaxID=6293 RepID=A0A1I8EIM4_WUCBA
MKEYTMKCDKRMEWHKANTVNVINARRQILLISKSLIISQLPKKSKGPTIDSFKNLKRDKILNFATYGAKLLFNRKI